MGKTALSTHSGNERIRVQVELHVINSTRDIAILTSQTTFRFSFALKIFIHYIFFIWQIEEIELKEFISILVQFCFHSNHKYMRISISIVSVRILQDQVDTYIFASSRYVSSPVRQTAADKLTIHCGLTITCFDYFDFSSLTPNDNFDFNKFYIICLLLCYKRMDLSMNILSLHQKEFLIL